MVEHEGHHIEREAVILTGVKHEPCGVESDPVCVCVCVCGSHQYVRECMRVLKSGKDLELSEWD